MKTRTQLTVWLSCLLILVGSTAVAQYKGEPAIQIVSSDQNRLTLALTFANWDMRNVNLQGEQFTSLDFPGAEFLDSPGAPAIPFQVAIVGIPPGANVRYRILDSDFSVLDNITVLPRPIDKQVEGFKQAAYVPDAGIYEASLAYPPQLVTLEEPAFYRNQQICRIQVAGAQFLPASQQVRQYKRMVLQLQFLGGSPQATPSLANRIDTDERLYQNVLLNYDQARGWRKTGTADRLRKSQRRVENTLFKFRIREEGIYRIDGAFLESNISNLNLAQVNPSRIRLYNNGGRELPRDLNATRPEGLVENAILVNDGGDGRFDRDDTIIFYGKGISGWEYDVQAGEFTHYINHYGFDNIYWLTLEGEVDGKRMELIDSGETTGNFTDRYQGLAFVEDERISPLQSGLNWFAREFAIDEVSRVATINLELPNAISSEPSSLEVSFIARTASLHRFDISMNGSTVGSHSFSGLAPFLNQYIRMQYSQFSTTFTDRLLPGTNSLQLAYSHSSTSGRALLDWIEVEYMASLHAEDNELAFTTLPGSGSDTYRITGFSSSSNVELFDVTDYAAVRKIVNFSRSGAALTFADSQDPNVPKRYVALSPARFKQIESLERTEFTDLRASMGGAEFIIITHDDFVSEALRLESFKENGNVDNRLQTEVAKISDIYNSFSGGLVDVTAIRDYIRFAYDNWSPKPGYVLLLGDGDFDPKNIQSSTDLNWIPTFQTDEIPTENHLDELITRTTDSWYTYVSGDDAIMDLAIGRINVQSIPEARSAVDKIVAYETRPLRGNWRNTITMVGDDELVGGGRPSAPDDVHITQTESIAENAFPDCFDIEKIYLPEFPKVTSAANGGVVKPAAREALIQQMNKGTLIVNYIGHGNSSLWAHEHVFRQEDNDRVQNDEKFIFFVAATCDWALFDKPVEQSQAEELLLAENRGAIAILTSARLVFSSGNFAFNRTFYDRLFQADGLTSRIGDAFVATRTTTGNITNDEKFHIFGDPTLRLAMPRGQAVFTSITPDSVVALTTMEVTGEIREGGQLQSDFNGTAFINTFDSRRFVENVPEAGSVQRYFLPGNSIYRGTVPVQNGRFSAKFVVPKDISYGGNQARISAYFWNEQTDGATCVEDILVSSTSANLADSEGPDLRVYFRESPNFVTGDIIPEGVTLVVDIADTVSGVNIAGEIGHRMTLVIDPDDETCISEFNRFNGISDIDLTGLFQFAEGEHLRGSVEFPLQFPEEVDLGGRVVSCINLDGEDRHTLVVKAWDNANNSSTIAVEVMVEHDEGRVFVEESVMNYPNPFAQNTTFSFISNRDAEVVIRIYTVSGQLLRTLEYPFATSGFNMLEWDGRDADGDFPANGVYLYKLIARSEGETGPMQQETIGRLAIIR